MAPRYPISFKVGLKYRGVEHTALERLGRSGARGDSIGEVVFKAPVGGIGAEKFVPDVYTY